MFFRIRVQNQQLLTNLNLNLVKTYPMCTMYHAMCVVYTCTSLVLLCTIIAKVENHMN